MWKAARERWRPAVTGGYQRWAAATNTKQQGHPKKNKKIDLGKVSGGITLKEMFIGPGPIFNKTLVGLLTHLIHRKENIFSATIRVTFCSAASRKQGFSACRCPYFFMMCRLFRHSRSAPATRYENSGCHGPPYENPHRHRIRLAAGWKTATVFRHNTAITEF